MHMILQHIIKYTVDRGRQQLPVLSAVRQPHWLSGAASWLPQAHAMQLSISCRPARVSVLSVTYIYIYIYIYISIYIHIYCSWSSSSSCSSVCSACYIYICMRKNAGRWQAGCLLACRLTRPRAQRSLNPCLSDVAL